VQQRIDSFAARWRESYPGAVRALLSDRESLTVYLRFPASTGQGCATPTSSSAPSARAAAGSRSSAGCPVSAPASSSSGPCSIAFRPAGAGSLRRRPDYGYSKTYSARCSNHRPGCPNAAPTAMRHHQKLSVPSHNINRIERSPRPGFLHRSWDATVRPARPARHAESMSTIALRAQTVVGLVCVIVQA
jgi:hypothetical protein